MSKERDSKSNQAAAQSRLSRLKQPQVWIPASAFAVSMLFVILFRVEGQPFQWKVDARDWTGLGQSYDNDVSEVTEKGTETTGTITKKIDKTTTTTKKLQPAKTLWDWTQLFLAPATLAVLGFRFQHLQEKAKREKEEADKARDREKEEADKARVADQQREQALQTYFDQLSTLLVDKQLKKLLMGHQATVPTKAPTEEVADSSVVTEAVTVKPEPLIDVEAALDVVKARTLSLLRMFDEDIPRKASVLSFLSDADLLSQLELDLKGIQLSGANLRKVNFNGADLSNADLTDAHLNGANLNGTKLEDAHLNGAKLRGAALEDAHLDSAKLQDAELNGAKLQDAHLNKALLRDAHLNSADLNGAYLHGAVLHGTDLHNTNLSDAKFWDAKLTGDKLDRAKKDAVTSIQSAKNWREAKYDSEMRALLGLPPETSKAKD